MACCTGSCPTSFRCRRCPTPAMFTTCACGQSFRNHASSSELRTAPRSGSPRRKRTGQRRFFKISRPSYPAQKSSKSFISVSKKDGSSRHKQRAKKDSQLLVISGSYFLSGSAVSHAYTASGSPPPRLHQSLLRRLCLASSPRGRSLPAPSDGVDEAYGA